MTGSKERKKSLEQIDNLIAIYRAARERLLNTIILSDPVGTRVYANTILMALQKELRLLQSETDNFIQVTIPEEYRDGLREVYGYFKRNKLMMRAPEAFASLHTDALYEISREMQHHVGDGLSQVGRQVIRYVDTSRDEALRQAGLEQTGIKTASGGTVQDMKNALIEQLQEEGFMTVQYGEGSDARQVPVDVYADMVARSTTREAGNTARINQLQYNGYDLVQMSTHYPTCHICAPHQGRVYSISGEDKRFPPLSTAFGSYNNIHPNCRHVATPFIESFYSEEEMKKLIEFSNQPYKDVRGAEEVALYKKQQDENRRSRQTLYQFERYKQRLGDAAPKSYSAFARMKRKGGPKWDELQRKYRAAGKAADDEENVQNMLTT